MSVVRLFETICFLNQDRFWHLGLVTFFTYASDTGALTYSAGVSRAFTGEEIRGAVEKVLAAEGVEATGVLVEAILKLLKTGAVPFRDFWRRCFAYLIHAC
jgi:hypothetical protein